MSVFHSTSYVRCLWLLRLWGCGQRGSVVHKSTGAGRRAELSGPRVIDRPPFLVEACETARAVEDGKPTVRILVDAHRRLDVVVAMGLRRDLQRAAVPMDAIVAADLAI